MAAHTQHVASDNFLLPNWTFIAELVAFVLILAFLWRYVVPPIRKMMSERQAIIEQQMADSDEAAARLAAAKDDYDKALAEARTEAAHIRENARAEAQRTIDELRAQAQEESARIVARGEEQLLSQRGLIVRELRGEIGSLAVELSEKIVEQRLADDAQVRATVDAFLADLERADSEQGDSAGASAGS
jgi:F-type H+-transporting ATPase subunit b